MGAWATGIFDNDEAADWAFGLETGGFDYLADALDLSPDDADYVDSFEGSAALAAAETVARMLGRSGPPSVYSEPVDSWVAAHPGPPADELLASARRAVLRVASEGSELEELWQDTDDDTYHEWRAALNDLLLRLG